LDELATRGLGLHSVRRQLTVVSQEPVLFSGSLRHNLDPAGEFTDDEMWAVLNKSPVKELVVPQLENGLDHVVQEGG
jgi:ATP-binding cassette subfamily C (CFTR/MRP) protein 4